MLVASSLATERFDASLKIKKEEFYNHTVHEKCDDCCARPVRQDAGTWTIFEIAFAYATLLI